MATSGTHDTESVAEWWETSPIEERRALTACVPGHELDPDAPFSPAIRDAVLEILYRSGSDIVLLPIQDVFGWRDRINTPASVSDRNWTWRLPWPIDDLETEPAARERAAHTRSLTVRSGR